MIARITPFISWVIFVVYSADVVAVSHWECSLVLFAALMIVPKGMWLIGHERPRWYWLLAAGLYIGLWKFPDPTGVIYALPYAIYAVWHGLWEVTNLLIFRTSNLQHWVRAAALAYWGVGALWILFFLADAHPFGFSSVFVGLTSAHFHFAGFVLAVLVLCMMEDNPCIATDIFGVGILLGMPLVATGITLTKLGFSPIYESIFALMFVALVLGIAGYMIYLIFQKRHLIDARHLWSIAASVLLLTMTMAAVYATRSFWPDHPWANMSKMISKHGTLNGIVFSWLSMRSWIYVKRQQMEEYTKYWIIDDPDDPLRFF